MITRIVHLQFKEEFLPALLLKLPEIKNIVTAQIGCNSLKIVRAESDNRVFTVSTWDSEQDLNNYRDSEQFKKIWSFFKPNFTSKAEAWTTVEI